MRVRTQAIVINEVTYPIAVACLPGGFATIPYANVNGCWLIINELSATQQADEFQVSGTQLTNHWMTQADFLARYDVDAADTESILSGISWYEVERKYEKEIHDTMVPPEEVEVLDSLPRPIYGVRSRRRMTRHLPGFRRG